MIDSRLTERWYSGITRPELWYMDSEKGEILIYFTEKCWEIFQSLSIRNINLDSNLFPSLTSFWGFSGIFQAVKKEKEYILRIDIESQVDDEKRNLVCQSLSSFFDLLNYFVSPEAEEERNPHIGEQVQLFSMNTYYSPNATYHGAGMEFSISPEAAKFLVEHSKQSIPGVHEAMKHHHIAKYPKNKKIGREGFFGALNGVIREEGTLNFVTEGNCACLGHMPKKIQENQGLYIDSHNLDITWQQLSMIVGIAVTWKWVRVSLNYK